MDWKNRIGNLLKKNFELGSFQFSLIHLIHFLLLLILVFLFAALIRKALYSRLVSYTGMSCGLQTALARFAGYVVIFIGVLASFRILGIDLSSLAFLAGALGLGLGFGLQNIISNFVSGIIILMERPIQVGDRIDVGGLQGDVVEINARSTKIVTNENITIIVPNSEFISSRVVNWSYGNPKVRFPVPVTVSYGSHPRMVEKALLEVAESLVDVLKDPAPGVRFIGFGDHGLHFELRVWTSTQVQRKIRLISMVNFEIFEKFQKYGIEIPFPQQDVHIKSMVSPGEMKKASPQEMAAAHLHTTRLFESLTDEDIEYLVKMATLRKYYPQQTIIAQDNEGDSLFVILTGIAGVYSRLDDGRNIRLTTLGRSDFFGEMSMLTGERRSATIIAEAPFQALEISKEHLQPILEKNPSLASKLSHALAEREAQERARKSANQIFSPHENHESHARGILQRIHAFFKLS